jgi:hypothetical protein
MALCFGGDWNDSLKDDMISSLSSICSQYQESRLYCSNNTNFGAINKESIKNYGKIEQENL